MKRGKVCWFRSCEREIVCRLDEFGEPDLEEIVVEAGQGSVQAIKIAMDEGLTYIGETPNRPTGIEVF